MLGPYPLDSIHCGECSVMLAALPDDCIDLTVTSPPYDNLRTYNGYVFDFEPIARQLWRVTKPGGVVVWVVGDATVGGSETGTSFRQALGFMALGFRLHDTMIYNRQGQYPDKLRYYADFEYMFVFSKGSPKSVSLITDKINLYAGTKIKGGDRQRNGDIKISWASRNNIKRKEVGIRSNIWKITANSQTSIEGHPAIFPEALARDHIISWSNPGDIVLDPMAGSGTTCKMAKETGRHWLGFDISQEYVDLARRRVDLARVPLFVETESVVIVKPEQAVMSL
jgi:DNA modification methylase